MGRLKKSKSEKVQIDVDWLLGETSERDVQRHVWIGRLLFLILFAAASTLSWPIISKQILLSESVDSLAEKESNEDLGLRMALSDTQARADNNSAATEPAMPPVISKNERVGARHSSSAVVAKLSDNSVAQAIEQPETNLNASIPTYNSLRPSREFIQQDDRQRSSLKSPLGASNIESMRPQARTASHREELPSLSSNALQELAQIDRAPVPALPSMKIRQMPSSIESLLPSIDFDEDEKSEQASVVNVGGVGAGSSHAKSRMQNNEQISVQRLANASDSNDITLQGMTKRSNDELVVLLASTQDRIVNHVVEELRHRGLRPQHIEIAIELARGTSTERLLAMDRLVHDGDLNPVPWLTWMANTADRTSRQRAISLLGSVGDEDAMRSLRMIKQREADDSIVTQITQVLLAAGSEPKLKR